MKFFDKQLLRRRIEPRAIDAQLSNRRAYSEFRKRMQYNSYLELVKRKYQEQDASSNKEDR